jgi:ERCC4-type nuclease
VDAPVKDGIPLLIDRRVGSADLFPLMQRRRVPVELVTLPFADFAFATVGPDGEPVTIGVERKRINDLTSSIKDGRLAGHQLPGLVEQYSHYWLLIEGYWRVDDGMIQVPRGRGRWVSLMSALGMERFLCTLELKAGCRIRQTADPEGTATFLEGLWGWWTQKAFDKHRSHLALHKPPDVALFGKPPLVQRVAAELQGVGFEKSAVIGRHFGTVVDLAAAEEGAWTAIPGIGTTLAQRIHHSLRKRG